MELNNISKKIKTFKLLRWLSALSFFMILLFIAIKPREPIIIITLAAYVISTLYILFWRCPHCNKFFSLKFGFISIAFPFLSYCMHCKNKLEG